MKKLIRLEKIQFWTLFIILVSYQVNVYSLGRQQIYKDLQTQRQVRNYENLSEHISQKDQRKPALPRSQGFFNMSDKFSEVLTIDYLLITSEAFENKQRSIIRVDPSGAQLQPRDNFSHQFTPQDKEIQSDQPFRPFISEQFKRVSAEMNQISEMVTSRRNQKMGIIRKKQRDRLVNKTIKRIRKLVKMYASFKEHLMT